jgi:GT2 family glycosyltransferase
MLGVIVLSFNNYEETTGPCLQSLAEDPENKDWHVLVVDNGSDAVTQTRLEQARVEHPRFEFLRNGANLGYAGGNNVGLKRISGDPVVLLNSDTQCPPGMLGRLAGMMESHPEFGLAGPVTNAAGNEQRIFVKPGSVASTTGQGVDYADAGEGVVLDCHRLDFFCVMLRRSVIERVGLLDESFGRGYYEDFDYCLRARAAGYRLGVVESAFIYHRGSASFGKIAMESKQLLKRNKLRIVEKHGAAVEFPHVRDGNLAVLRAYARMLHETPSRLEYRIRNRLRLAWSDQPRGWFKRFRYRRRLKAIEAALQLSPVLAF